MDVRVDLGLGVDVVLNMVLGIKRNLALDVDLVLALNGCGSGSGSGWMWIWFWVSPGTASGL